MIDLLTFKKDLENSRLIETFYIFIGKDLSSEFLFDQYIHFYATQNHLEITDVVDTQVSIADFFTVSDDIKRLKVDKLEYIHKNFKGWIFCKSVSKEIKSEFDNIIELPKLEKWQIIDFISTRSNIEISQAEKLMTEYTNLYKLDIESRKLSIFDVNLFEELEDQLLLKEEYQIFDLTNALLRRDKEKLKQIYGTELSVDAFAFLSILIKNFKLVIDVQLARNTTAESLGISGKQFWAIQKYNCNRYSKQELVYIYKLLTSLDLKIKTGQFDTNIMKDYIIFKIMSL